MLTLAQRCLEYSALSKKALSKDSWLILSFWGWVVSCHWISDFLEASLQPSGEASWGDMVAQRERVLRLGRVWVRHSYFHASLIRCIHQNDPKGHHFLDFLFTDFLRKRATTCNYQNLQNLPDNQEPTPENKPQKHPKTYQIATIITKNYYRPKTINHQKLPKNLPNQTASPTTSFWNINQKLHWRSPKFAW